MVKVEVYSLVSSAKCYSLTSHNYSLVVGPVHS